MDLPADVPYAMIQMMPDLEQTVSGEGTDGQGRRFMIQRYVSKTCTKTDQCYQAKTCTKSQWLPVARSHAKSVRMRESRRRM